jgi:hypothetical protein
VLLVACQARANEQPLLAHFEDASEIVTVGPISIFRMELDVTGDGVPELFLSQSQNAGPAGNWWMVYSPQGDGTYRFLGDLVFHRKLFSFDDEKMELTALGGQSASQAILSVYRFHSDGIEVMSQEELSMMSEAAQDARRDFEEWGERERPVVWWASLSDVEAGGTATWKGLDDRSSQEEVWSFAGRLVTE